MSPNDEGYARQVSVLVVTDERFLDHRPGRGHPERPARLEAVWSGLKSAGLGDALVCREPRPASDEDLMRCHPSAHLAALVEIDAAGGGLVDGDTVMSPGSWSAARLAAGAGLVAVAALQAGEADVAFCAVRPPGHHATPSRAMGFCLVNNLAVTAASLAEAGERVAIVDIDAQQDQVGGVDSVLGQAELVGDFDLIAGSLEQAGKSRAEYRVAIDDQNFVQWAVSSTRLLGRGVS